MAKRSSKKKKINPTAQATLEADIAALPKVDMLQDLPSFEDLRVRDSQVEAFNAYVASAEEAIPYELGCVIRLDRGFPLVATANRTVRAEHAHALAKGDHLLPAIGDWVVLACPLGHDMGRIDAVLPRATAFERWRGKNRGEKQTLAANVDTVLIVQALNTDPLRCGRLARSLVLVNDCGARPVILLTKADRKASPQDLQADIDMVRSVCGDVEILVTSAFANEGLDDVRRVIPAGTIAMILGESGAGKSTLLNGLLGHEAAATQCVREKDDMGRHTTVARVMYALEGCGVMADAPGLRSLPLVGHERGLAITFPEIVRAAHGCKFRDCTHTHEPGCEVLAQCEQGNISAERLEVFLTLASEMRVSAQSLDPDIVL